MVEAVALEQGWMWRHSPDLLSVLNLQAEAFDKVSPAWSATLGWALAELEGVPYAKFIHPDDLDATTAALRMAGIDEPLLRFENRCRHKDGEYRWISWSIIADGGIVHCVGRDITEQLAQAARLARAADALRQASKVEAVGQLAGGIVHDINNMLGVVIGALDRLRGCIRLTDESAIRYAEAALDGAHRASSLTQRLLGFSRQLPSQPDTIDVNALIGGMSELIAGSLGPDIRLQTKLAGDLWPVCADANRFENVLFNLAVNARDAIPQRGQLSIETRNYDLEAHEPATGSGVAPGQYVIIAVADTGVGMCPEVVAKAFEPFFSTKDVGKGTGLGLSQVRDFAIRLGGHVHITSEPGRGTTVTLYIPRMQADDDFSAGIPRQKLRDHIPLKSRAHEPAKESDMLRRLPPTSSGMAPIRSPASMAIDLASSPGSSNPLSKCGA